MEILIKFQNTLSTKNIKRLKDKFIQDYIGDSPDQPNLLDYDNGIISEWFNNKMNTVKFEDKLNQILWDLTNELKSEIEEKSLILKPRDLNYYFHKIIENFQIIEHKNKSSFEKFKICYKPKEEIESYLKDKFEFVKKSYHNNTYFNIKREYKIRHLKIIYNFLINEFFIDDDIYSFEDFKEVLFDFKTKKQLTFKVKTPLIICFLKNLSPIFIDFNRKRICESNRFKTKSNTLITIKTYDSNMNRLKKTTKEVDKMTISKINSLFKDLL